MSARNFNELLALLNASYLPGPERPTRVRAAAVAEVVRGMLDSSAYDRVDALSLGLDPDTQSPEMQLGKFNDACATAAAQGRALVLPPNIYKFGNADGNSGIIAQDNLRIIAHGATVHMSIVTGGGFNASIQNAVEGVAVNGYGWHGGLFMRDPTSSVVWDGNAVTLFGNENFFDGTVWLDYAVSGGRLFSGGGTFMEPLSGLGLTAGSPIINFPPGYKLTSRDDDTRVILTGAGPGGEDLIGWVRNIHNQGGTGGAWATCELYDRVTGLALDSEITTSVGVGRIDRAGTGTTMFRCRGRNNTLNGIGSAGIRVNYGSSSFLFVECHSGDDASFQCVPKAGTGFGALETISDVIFLYVRGGSSEAKLLTVTDGGNSVPDDATHDTKRIHFVGVPGGYAGGRALHFEKNNGYGGFVGECLVRDVTCEMGEADRESRAPYGLNLLNLTDTPRAVRDITCENVRIKSPWQEAIQAEGSLGRILFKGGELGPTRRDVNDEGDPSPRVTVKISCPEIELIISETEIHAAEAECAVKLFNVTPTGPMLVDINGAKIDGIKDGFPGVLVDGPYRVLCDRTTFTPEPGHAATVAIQAEKSRACDVVVGAMNDYNTASDVVLNGSGPGQLSRIKTFSVLYDGGFNVESGATITFTPPSNKTAGWMRFVEGPNFFSFGFDRSGSPQIKPGENVGNRFTTTLTTANRINLACTASGITVENLSGGARDIAVEMVAS